MPASQFTFRLAILSLAALGLFGVSCRPPKRARSNAFAEFPKTTLWAWESREDLVSIDPRKYGVAYLAETVTIDDSVTVIPRRQPMRVPPGANVMAVVRLEMRSTGQNLRDAKMVDEVAEKIVSVVDRPEITALQIDFDATVSQREFYRLLLQKTRARMPQTMPLSMTALASWCAGDDWIAGLPVDEAVPMFFRMGQDARPNLKPGWSYPIQEPLCMTSAGVSMDEPWPLLSKGTRIYIFHPTAWNEIALQNLKQVEP